jgi:hypothetical protein
MKEELNNLQNEFLTGQQLRGIPVPPGVMMSADTEIEKELSFDSNLHKEEQFISNQRKNEIDAEIEKYISKNSLAEERLLKEVEKVTKKNTSAPEHPRNILTDLLTKGELTKTFDVANHKWTLRALDQGDILLAMDDLKDSIQTEAGRLTSVVFSKVVYSIEAIDDIPIYQFFPEIKPQDHPSKIDYIITVKRALRAYLIGMAPKIIDLLYYKYIELEDERDKALDTLKNS